MLKKLATYLTVIVFCIQQALAGNGSSVPVNEEQQEPPKRTKTPASNAKEKEDPAVNDDDVLAGIIIGGATLAAVGIGVYAAYKASQPDTEEYSSDSEFLPEETEIVSIYGYPAIDMRIYEDFSKGEDGVCYMVKESFTIDLHPYYTNEPYEYLKKEIGELQRAYYRSEITDDKIYVITGTALKRSYSKKYTLQTYVEGWLKEDFFYRRIRWFGLTDEGLFTVILRKYMLQNRKPPVVRPGVNPPFPRGLRFNLSEVRPTSVIQPEPASLENEEELESIDTNKILQEKPIEKAAPKKKPRKRNRKKKTTAYNNPAPPIQGQRDAPKNAPQKQWVAKSVQTNNSQQLNPN